MLSVNPNLTEHKVRSIIKRTAWRVSRHYPGYIYSDNPDRPNYGTWNERVGHGLVDAYAAVRKALCIQMLTNESVTYSRTITSCGNIYVQNVTIANGVELTLIADGNIYIYNVTISNNARLILYAGGDIIIDGYLDIYLGAEFEMR